jgi:hypothetical protein
LIVFDEEREAICWKQQRFAIALWIPD